MTSGAKNGLLKEAGIAQGIAFSLCNGFQAILKHKN